MKNPAESVLKSSTSHCYVCGPENPLGLHAEFERDGPSGCRAFYTARSEHAGWPGLLHGGVALALMDEALAWALYFQGRYGVTARVETRFRQPIPVGTRMIIRGWTLAQRRRLVEARAEIREQAEGTLLLAEAAATMYLHDTPPSVVQENAV